MVWGCFCKDRIGPLILVDGSVNSATYIKILGENLIPFLTQHQETQCLVLYI